MRPLLTTCVLLLAVSFFLAGSGVDPAGAQPTPVQIRLYGGLEAHVFGLEEIKDWQREQQQIMTGNGMPVQAVESFPGYGGARFEVVAALRPDFRVGLGGGYGSTGGRLHYADYTGEVRYDQVVSRRHLSLLMEGRKPEVVPIPAWVTLQLRYNFSRVDTDGYLRVGETSDAFEEDFSARGLSIEPGIALEVRRGIGVARLSAALEYAVTSGLGVEALMNTLYFEEQQTRIHADWSGVRLGLSLGLMLPDARRP